MQDVAPIIDTNLSHGKSPLDLQACKKCNQLIYEGHAYELGDDRWHIDCFKCSKCSSSLGCNSNFLVLGNGNLICSNCSYNCKQCGKKIDDLAILTGDQAYCSNCFKCRSCKQNIEDLRYARTSKGLFCMDCHEKLMLKKKKYDAKKKLLLQQEQGKAKQEELKQQQEQQQKQQEQKERDQQQQQQQQHKSKDEENVKSKELDESRMSNNSSRNSILQSYLTTPSTTNILNSNPLESEHLLLSPQLNISTSSISKNKTLPEPPSLPTSIPTDRPRLESHDSYSSARSDLPNENDHRLPPDNDFSIEEVVNDSDDNEDVRTDRPSLRTPKASVPIPSLRRPQSPKIQDSQPGGANIYLDLIDGPETPKASTLQDAADISPHPESLAISNATISNNHNNKNVLILSPNQFNDNEFHSAIVKSPVQSSSSSQLTIHTNGSNSNNTVKSQNLSIGEEPKSRSNCPSPFAKANRQARVVETNDEIQTEGIDEVPDDDDEEDSEEYRKAPKKKDLNGDNENDNNDTLTGNGFENESERTSVVTPNLSSPNISTPQRRIPTSSHSSIMSSPPPKLPLPSTPIKKRFKFDESETTPKGLGLEGVDYDVANEQRDYLKSLHDKKQQQVPQQHQDATHPLPPQQSNNYPSNVSDDYIVNKSSPLQSTPFNSSTSSSTKSQRTIGNTTPAVTNLEETTSNDETLQVSSSISSSISRMGSIRTPKLSSLKHKRSTSGGNANGGGHSASNSISKFFKSATSNSSKEDLKGHARHVSDGSISNASAFTTPPLPSPRTANYGNGSGYSTNFHIRSTSDTPFLTSLEHNNDRGTALGSHDFTHYDNFEVKSLKFEIGQLSNQKIGLENDIKKLTTDKLKLNDQLKLLQSKVITETSAYETLAKKIKELELQNSQLFETNEKLKLQNQSWDRRNGSGANTTIGSTSSRNIDDDFNSTSSTLINHSYSDANGEEIETQKATRLKFWRRPKIGFSNNNSPNLVLTNPSQQPLSISPPQPASSQLPPVVHHQQGQIPNLQPQPPSQNGYASKISQSYSSQSIRIPSQNGISNGNHGDDIPERKGKFTKSRSNNIIDSFLSNNNLHTNSSNDSSSGGSIVTAAGASLFNSTIQRRADYEQVQVPLIVTKCLAEVELRGLDMEGIYRISGASSTINAIENTFSSLTVHSIQDEKQMAKLEDIMSGDIHAVTSALKRYFRKLPDPLIPYSLYEEFIKVSSVNSIANVDQRITDLKVNVIDKLPTANKHTLHLLCKHLKLVSSYSAVNRMGFKNLSVIFAPTIARDETGQREMLDMGHRSETTEVLLSNSEQVFENFFG